MGCGCNCEGPGIESMTTEELIMLKNMLRKAAKYDEQAAGTLFAVEQELKIRNG